MRKSNKDTTIEPKVSFDRYGQAPDDEFFELSFLQSSDDGVKEVKPLTYALMCLWKVRMGNEDTISISEHSDGALLNFDSTYNGSDSGDTNLTPDDEIELDNVIEVDEKQGRVSLFCYIPRQIPEELTSLLALACLNINPNLQYGHIEVYTTTSDGESLHYIRYRASVALGGVKVGKTDAIENMLNTGLSMFGVALDAACKDNDIRKWILE
jgi:hypothetical protein